MKNNTLRLLRHFSVIPGFCNAIYNNQNNVYVVVISYVGFLMNVGIYLIKSQQ